MTGHALQAPVSANNGSVDIAIRLRSVSQLFNTFDPAPFREKDLDPEAETYIMDWVKELPERTRLCRRIAAAPVIAESLPR